MKNNDRDLIVCYCVCGGWVFASILGHDKKSDSDTYREVAKLVKQGFSAKSLTVRSFNDEGCPNCGQCTTNPKKTKSETPLFLLKD